MDNIFLKKVKGVLKIKIKGKRINSFINRLYASKIPLLEIKYPKYDEIDIKIYKDDYSRIKDIKTIYDIYIIDSYGIYKLKKIFKTNIFLISSLILGLVLLWFLTNTIFKIEVVHNDKQLRNILINELEENGIKVYKMKKNYQQLQKIKDDIISKYKDKIEWLEIENIGTRYIVRVEERKIIFENNNNEKQHIISLKNSIIRKVIASSGEIIKNKNDYVKAGEIVISGNISLYDNIKSVVRAEGKVYGEVWYQTSVEYPLTYQEKKETGKKKSVLSINFLNKSYNFFNFNPFKNKKIDLITLLKNPLIPLKLVIEKQKEIEVIDQIYTEEQAIDAAINLARKKMEENLEEDEYIIKQNNLKINIKDSKIVLDVFFAVYENITGYQKIEEIIN